MSHTEGLSREKATYFHPDNWLYFITRHYTRVDWYIDLFALNISNLRIKVCMIFKYFQYNVPAEMVRDSSQLIDKPRHGLLTCQVSLCKHTESSSPPCGLELPTVLAWHDGILVIVPILKMYTELCSSDSAMYKWICTSSSTVKGKILKVWKLSNPEILNFYWLNSKVRTLYSKQ